MDIGTHDYGRDLYGDDHPVINAVRDMLLAEGASTREEAAAILPDVERMLGALTDRERAAVLRRFGS